MAVKIRLLRMGKIRNPQYRIVVADSRTKRDGKAIEFIGIYQPKEHPSIIEVNSERAQYWLSVGAQPSEPVQRLLEKTGDWQKFKGLPAPPPLLMAAPRADRKALYEAEASLAAGLAPAPEVKPSKKAAERKAEAPKAESPKAESPKAEAPKAEAESPKAEAPKAEAAPIAEASAAPVAEAAAAPVAEVPVAPAAPVAPVADATTTEGSASADAAAES